MGNQINKKEKIMQAALKIFEKKGAEKTSVRDIMTEAGFGLGTFYLYYSDKNDLQEKMVLNLATDIILSAEKTCVQEDPIERYISFVDFIIDYLISHPFELDLLSKNITWTLYTKIENDYGLSEADSTLQFILNKYDNLFLTNHTESEKLYILSLTLEIMMSTCKSAVLDDSILTIDEMKPVLFAIIRKIFNRIGENK
ncbi:TetR/AcrR family transcriptional regulator [Anaerococcus rubeinfantis]|uniref:TetR/AcrR family transcriptional regulator n=1 Tax=Anaerococcus rubeinfantis TaxID=1720199 RepID=UPI00073F343F|nr:TetR/AcrR family transcriptional regulator [Anaerococcus rubeinfantis]